MLFLFRKKTNNIALSNFHPILLFPAISKGFDIAINQHIIEYFDQHHFCTDNQFGYRENKSTSDVALLSCTNYVFDNFDNNFLFT